jgi:hypothetical protein
MNEWRNYKTMKKGILFGDCLFKLITILVQGCYADFLLEIELYFYCEKTGAK